MNNNRFPVMLFAAGFGTRMGDLTKNRPKPLIKVADKALIDYAIDLAKEVKPSEIVANLHFLSEQLSQHLVPQGVLLSNEQPNILETGGGLRHALPLLGSDPVFTMNTDVIWIGPNPLNVLADAWDPERMDALLMCVPVAQTVGYNGAGDFTSDQSGRVERGPGLVYGGVQLIKTAGLSDVSDASFSLNVLWNQMQSRGRLFALRYPGQWCDVGYPGGIALAEEALSRV